MRLSFQVRPWDLFLVLAYAVAITGALLSIGTGNPLAIVFFLFCPGYVLVAALFPESGRLDWISRLVISVGLSFALVPLLALLLNFSPLGIHLSSLVSVIALFTILVGLLGCWRRFRLPPDRRLAFALELGRLRWRGDSAVDKALTVGVVVSVAFMASAFAYVMVVPRTPDRYTTFYLLGTNGTVGSYPSRLNVSEQTQVTLGVLNREGSTTTYTVVADLVGVRLVFNATRGFNETIEVNRTRWSRFDFSIGEGESWTQSYPFSVDASGRWRLEFRLYRDGDFSAAYKSVHLMLLVGMP